MCAVLGGCGDRPTGTLWVVAVVFSIPIGVQYIDFEIILLSFSPLASGNAAAIVAQRLLLFFGGVFC